MHGAGEIDLVFVVHGDTDEELSLARRRANVLTQFVASFDKVVRVASDGGVSHVCEFDIVAARQERIQDCRDLALEHEFTVDELDFLLLQLCRSYQQSKGDVR